MKVAVSLPTELFERADESAARLGLNRSQLYARAIAEFLSSEDPDPITTRLDELADDLATEDGGRRSARQLVDTDAWQW